MKLKEKIQWVLTIGGFVFGIMGTLRWQGPAGRDGINGKDGINGINGINGVDGKDGRDGVDGINGINGIDGLNGLNGIDGKDGRDGVDGKDGKDGSTPYIGENGNWFIDGVDLGVCAVGKDGKDGVDGKDGKDGVDGKDGKDGILYESPTETIVYPTSWIENDTFASSGYYGVFKKQRKISPSVFEVATTKEVVEFERSYYAGSDMYIHRHAKYVFEGEFYTYYDVDFMLERKSDGRLNYNDNPFTFEYDKETHQWLFNINTKINAKGMLYIYATREYDYHKEEKPEFELYTTVEINYQYFDINGYLGIA